MKTRRSKVPGHGWIAAAVLAAVVLFPVPVPHARADAQCGARYTISTDLTTVTDNDTQLTWQRQADGVDRSWSQATSYCQGLTLPGAGWRLPTVFELQTIVDLSKANPAIDQTAFPDTPSTSFWSSLYTRDPSIAWYVHFLDGHVYYEVVGSAFRVRCVR